MDSVIEERPCSLAFPSHAITGNSEHHLAKAKRCGTLSWKDSLVHPENCTKQLHDTVQLLHFNSEVTICDQQELVAFQQCRYNRALPWQSKVSLLLSPEGWLEGVKFEGKCSPCISWSSVKKPHKEKATEKHRWIVISYSALTRAYVL